MLLQKEPQLKTEAVDVVLEEVILNSQEGSGSMKASSPEQISERHRMRAREALDRDELSVMLGWKTAFENGKLLLERRDSAMQCCGTCPSGNCGNPGACRWKRGELSMVEVGMSIDEGPTVKYIHWADIATRQGRITRIDKFGGVISLVYVDENQFPKTYDGTLIVPCVGTTYEKVAEVKTRSAVEHGIGKKRPIINKDMLLLQDMWQVALNGGECQWSNKRIVPECYVCGESDNVNQCPLCMMTFHEECVECVADRNFEKECCGVVDVSKIGVHVLPTVFNWWWPQRISDSRDRGTNFIMLCCFVLCFRCGF